MHRVNKNKTNYCIKIMSQQLVANNLAKHRENVGRELAYVWTLLSEVELTAQPSRPRTQKDSRPRTDFSRTDSRSRGQGHKAQVFSKKKGLQKIFQATSKKKSVCARRHRFSEKNQAFSEKKNKKGLRIFSPRFLPFLKVKCFFEYM